jgi:DNA-directed RNA polymerase subunit RPC12/RpoP
VTIEFSCQTCGKTLSTSDDKAGRKAKCPQCGDPVVVPAPTSGETDDEALAELPAIKTGSAKSTRLTKCPMCGAGVSPGDASCAACGEPLVEAAVRRRVSTEPQRFEIGVVLSRTWDIFKQDLGLVVGSQLVLGLLTFAAFIPGIGLFLAGILTMDQGPAGPDIQPMNIILFAVGGLLALVGMAVAQWLLAGNTKLMLGLVRGEEVGIGTLFQGGRFFWRLLGCSLLYQGMVSVGQQLCVIPAFLVMIFFWPFQYLLVDDDLPHIQALFDAPKWSQPSWLSTIGLGFVQVGIAILGLLALGIGLIFAGPFITLSWCVAYDEMRGGTRVADEME